MTPQDSGLYDLIEAGDIPNAVQAATESSPLAVLAGLDYDRMDEYAEAYLAFFPKWLGALPPGIRMHAAREVSGHVVTALVHVPDAHLIGGQMELAAMASVRDEVAAWFDDFYIFTDPPDGEIDEAVRDRLRDYATTLRDFTFDRGRTNRTARGMTSSAGPSM